MKKVLYLLGLTIILTGCTANYNLTIDEKSVKEDFTLTIERNNFDASIFHSEGVSHIDWSDDPSNGYVNELTEDEDNYYLKFDLTNEENGLYLNQCYSNVNLTEEDDTITLSTDKVFNCMYDEHHGKLDEATINVITKLKVLESNADSVEGNKYIWKIDMTNYQNKPIKIVLKKNFKLENLMSENDASIMMAIIVAPILVIAIVIVSVIKYKFKKSNNF